MQKKSHKKRIRIILACFCFVFACSCEAKETTDQSLLGYWPFDEQNANDVIQNQSQSEFSVQPNREIPRVEGLFGKALDLSGNFLLPIDSKIVPNNIEQITLAAWVRPRQLSGFREIIRKEDGDQRFLLSFQDNGTILSLGLNIANYYIECDAPIALDEVLDDNWHFAAATFDGKTMRVYLDGYEIGQLEKKGNLTIGQAAPVTIGSNGESEFFDGLLDDLRFYDVALSKNEIESLYQKGNVVLKEQNKAAFELVQSFYEKKESFTKTLSALRLKFVQNPDMKENFNRSAQGILVRQLRDDFPDDLAHFVKQFKMSISEFLTASMAQMKDEAIRMIGLYTEYKPLTEDQWKFLSPEETEKWKQIENVEKSFNELIASSEDIDDIRWFEMAFEMSRSIQERPYQREPVAPYQIPKTPDVVDLTQDQARQKLEEDWLFQCDGKPTIDRIRQEIDWSFELIERLASDVDLEKETAQLKQLQAEVSNLDGQNQEFYFKVRTLKRAIMMKNPVIDFDSILYVDMPYPQGSEWAHETRHRLGYMAVPGARLMTLTGLSPAGRQKMLMPKAPLHGSFWRPDLSWDGKKVLVSFKPHNEKAFHLYEIDIDGNNVRQLTSGMFDDFDPIYLPDGENIVFSTTRGYTYVRCMPPTNAFVLARMKLDSSNLYLISRNNEPDYLPSVLPDGRIVFSRWEYTDKPLWRCVSVWTMNPDGTQTQILWGNQTVWPDLPKDVRAVPDSNRLIFTGSAHHNWFSGSIGLIDPTKGLNFPDGLTKITAEIDWPESGNGPIDPIESTQYHRSGNYTAYDSPYPLSENDFLVSATRNGKYVLLLMDTDGNRELIYEGVNNIFYAQPIRSRDVPPVIADRVKWPTWEERNNPEPGIIYSNNVYDNAPEELRNKAKYLRIMNIEPKTYTYWDNRPYISTGPAVSMVQSEGVKRILGTVPIEEDGSVSFYAPSGVALHFQLLDENMKCLQTMRSFTGVMPGESRGCLGCHESQITTPAPQTRSIAVMREPSTITPPPWDDISVSYERYVQPTLDKHCGECHSGDGEAKKIFDTTMRPGFLHFNEPYITLIGNPSWGAPAKLYRSGSRSTWGYSDEELEEAPPGFGIADTIQVEAYSTVDPAAYVTPKPMEKLSYSSRLINHYCTKKHYNVELDPIEMLRMIVWVDAICPYSGSDDIRKMPDPKFQGSDWISIPPRLETAPVVKRPGPFDPFGSDDAYNNPTDQKVYSNPAFSNAPIIKKR
ncbi:MAG: LamG-like jellyroll fold domain-containing protein [Planctomycetia bacterium]|nr:LamG-like jellyroll fold domain-containing protein [Planctomycetia bacterium]